MNIWKSLFDFGIVDKGAELIDEAFHTKEEQAKLKAVFLKLYEPYKLAQRLLAIMVTVPFVSLHLFFSIADAVIVLKGGVPVLGDLAQRNIDTLGEGWTWIMIWYFTGGMIEGGVKAFRGVKK